MQKKTILLSTGQHIDASVGGCGRLCAWWSRGRRLVSGGGRWRRETPDPHGRRPVAHGHEADEWALGKPRKLPHAGHLAAGGQADGEAVEVAVFVAVGIYGQEEENDGGRGHLQGNHDQHEKTRLHAR